MHSIRIATFSDLTEIRKLFKETIQTVNKRDYSFEEIEDWVSCVKTRKHWKKLIENLYFIVSLNKDKQITGFSSISKKGYLHSMYIHKDYQNQGIASLLYNKIEAYAYQHKISKILTEASITAKPFFEKQGYKVDFEQRRKANQLFLTNYQMSKELH